MPAEVTVHNKVSQVLLLKWFQELQAVNLQFYVIWKKSRFGDCIFRNASLDYLDLLDYLVHMRKSEIDETNNVWMLTHLQKSNERWYQLDKLKQKTLQNLQIKKFFELPKLLILFDDSF